MKKAILLGSILVIVPLAAILLWYVVHTRQIESELDRYVAWARSQKMVPVDIVVTAPAETPKNQMLYLSGSAPTLGAWDAAGVPMQKKDDGRYQATVEVMSGVEHGFKVTRGTWGTVEKGPNDQEIPNHVLKVDQPGPVEVAVVSWVDHGKAVPGRITMTGDIRLHKKFRSEPLKNERTIIIYLPPGYDSDESKRFPVLYMHDGQNLFDEATSFNGIEWKVDETAQKLNTDGKVAPIIIVGIYNTEQRNPEFTPGAPAAKESATDPRGDLYGRFIVEEVKPFVDRTYRTMPDRVNTALAGSSMGGMITLYMAKVQNKTFGKIAALTPWLRDGGHPLVEKLGTDNSWMKQTRFWVDMGSAGGANYPGPDPMGDARALVQQFQSAGLQQGKDFEYLALEGGEHNEPAWASRIDKVLLFLFPK